MNYLMAPRIVELRPWVLLFLVIASFLVPSVHSMPRFPIYSSLLPLYNNRQRSNLRWHRQVQLARPRINVAQLEAQRDHQVNEDDVFEASNVIRTHSEADLIPDYDQSATTTTPTPEQDDSLFWMDRRSRPSSKADGGQIETVSSGAVDPYFKLNPDRYERQSPEWNLAMIKFLMEMKENGHKIKEYFLHQGIEGLEGAEITMGENGPVICKMEPFNICYEVESDGSMHPVGDRRPVRLLRVYKRSRL